MTFKIFSSIRSVKKEWESIKTDSIYQSYPFNLLLYKYKKTSLSNWKKGNIKTAFVVAYDDNKAVAIAPLAVDRNPKCVRLLGYGSNAGRLDFIYSRPDYADKLWKYCIELFKGYPFEFAFVDKNSPLHMLMNEVYEFENYCIKIEKYNEWYEKLSKNMRQNIRTSYNRLGTDNRTYKLEEHADMVGKLAGQIDEIYKKRKITWNKGVRVKTVNMHRDIVYNSVNALPESKLYVLKIDDEVAAFLIGYVTGDRISIPRLAINEEYSRYSPGIVLINEFLKKETVRYFDLGRGQESYKSKLSGDMYNTYNMRYEG